MNYNWKLVTQICKGHKTDQETDSILTKHRSIRLVLSLECSFKKRTNQSTTQKTNNTPRPNPEQRINKVIRKKPTVLRLNRSSAGLFEELSILSYQKNKNACALLIVLIILTEALRYPILQPRVLFSSDGS